MNETVCPRCDRGMTDDRGMCRNCQHELEVALGDCRWLDEEIETTITRQRSAPIEGGSPSATRGLPWHDKAAEARRTLHGLLVSWVRFCGEEAVVGLPNRHPRDTVPSLAAWLLHCTHGLAMRDIGPEAVDEITDAVAECRRLVFWKRSARVYLGRCEREVTDEDGLLLIASCDGDVYAEESAEVGACDLCEQPVDVAEQRKDLNERLDDMLMTPAEIARAAVFLGLQAPRESVRKRVNYWSRHEQILVKGHAENGDPRFRYGDVRDRLVAEFRKDRDAS